MTYSFAHPEESCTLLRKHAPSVDQDVCLTELGLVKDARSHRRNERKRDRLHVESRRSRHDRCDEGHMGLKAAITPEETFDMSFLPKAGAPR